MKYPCLPVVCCFSASIPVYREDYNSRKNCETINNHIVGLVHKHHIRYYRWNLELARPTNVSDVPRSLKLSFNHLIGRTHSWHFSIFYFEVVKRNSFPYPTVDTSYSSCSCHNLSLDVRTHASVLLLIVVDYGAIDKYYSCDFSASPIVTWSYYF